MPTPTTPSKLTVPSLKAPSEKRTFSKPPAVTLKPKGEAPPVAEVTEEDFEKIEAVEATIKDLDQRLDSGLEQASERMASALESFNENVEAIRSKLQRVDELSFGEVTATFSEAARLTKIANDFAVSLEQAYPN